MICRGNSPCGLDDVGQRRLHNTSTGSQDNGLK